MKRLLSGLLAFIIATLPLGASVVRDVDITVRLAKNGDAAVTEVWNLSQDSGTEWYLVRSNLDGSTITDLSVTDTDGVSFICEDGNWDVDRSLDRKAGRCGIVRKSNGCEICWGLGSYGDHIFTVKYTLTGAVRALDDYDYFHFQLVSPGLSSAPQHVKVTMTAAEGELSDANSRIWGFGYYGTCVFSDGAVVAESSEPFSSQSSVIILARFDKGMFSPEITESGSFEEREKAAMEGSDFGEEEDDEGNLLAHLFPILMALLAIFGVSKGRQAFVKSFTGYKKLKQIPFGREVPYGGDILKTNYVLSKLESSRDGNIIASAMILRMIQDGSLVVRKDGKGKVEIAFSDSAKLDAMPSVQRELYNMMKEASGADVILQDKEFSRWSNRNKKRVDRWCTAVETASEQAFESEDGVSVGLSVKLSDDAKKKAAGVFAFKHFLQDFTLSKERASQEVIVWNDYLVFAALYGIAAKVSKELADIDPKKLAETVYGDAYTMRRVIVMTNSLSNNITNASAAQRQKAASGGFGGSSSFGGGGGFHGGGFGGGAR